MNRNVFITYHPVRGSQMLSEVGYHWAKEVLVPRKKKVVQQAAACPCCGKDEMMYCPWATA